MFIGRLAIATALCLSIFLGMLERLAIAAGPPSPPIYEMALEEAWIAMPDGVLLAADLYLPKAQTSKESFPVLLEYLP
jgi:predicted acyl esterase